MPDKYGRLTKEEQLQSMVSAVGGTPAPIQRPKYNANNTLTQDLNPQRKSISVTDPNPTIDSAGQISQEQIIQHLRRLENPQLAQPQAVQMPGGPGSINPQIAEEGADNGEYDQQLQMKLKALRKLQDSGSMGQ